MASSRDSVVTELRREANAEFYTWLTNVGYTDEALESPHHGGQGDHGYRTGVKVVSGLRLPYAAAALHIPLDQLRARHPDLGEAATLAVVEGPARILRDLRLKAMLTVAELADYALTRPEDILEYEEGHSQPDPSAGARALATFGLTPGQLAGRYPPDVVAEVAGWSSRDPDTPRYHQIPNSRLRFVVWRILPSGAVPPGVAHDRDITDDNPLNGEPCDLLLTAEPNDDVADLVDTIAERHDQPHAVPGHWILRLPMSGRLYPLSCQGVAPIRDHTKVVAPPVDTAAHLNDLVGPGQAMLLNLDTDGQRYVLRCLSAWHEMTGNVPADIARGLSSRITQRARSR